MQTADGTADELADLFEQAIQHAAGNTARSAQQQDFRLGMSDLGHCREYARRMIVQEPYTDVRDKSAAFIGSVLGEAVEHALISLHPDAGWVRQDEVVTTLPSGTQIVGHPDLYKRDLVVDLKSKDGFEVVKRMGSTQQQHFQKHGYALGLVQEGKVDPAGLVVANVYIDRSGKQPRPHVVAEPWDDQIGDKIDLWLEDVFYAVMHQEEAERDMPRDWCERWCEYFTGCRLYDTDVTGLLTAPDVLAAVQTYEEGKRLEREGARLKAEAKPHLEGVAGSTGTHMVRWTQIEAATIAASTRAAYKRLDIRPITKGTA